MARTGIRATARIPTNRLEALAFGPLTDRTAHMCIDMQNVFAEETPWHTPWMARVLPVVTRIAERHPSQTVFTRFIPPPRPDRMPGGWQRYYERWRELTLERNDPRLIELVPPLAALAPPAEVIDKRVYSPFSEPELSDLLRRRWIESLVITGRLRSRRGPRRRRPRLPSRARDRCAVQFIGRHARCVADPLPQPFQSAGVIGSRLDASTVGDAP